MHEPNDSSARSTPGSDARPGDARPSARRRQRERALAEARLYVCTDARAERGDLESFLHAAYAGGADIIQLRDKSLEVDRELEALRLLARIAAEHGRLFAVNDRADLAAVVGADVFHSGQHDLTPDEARLVTGPDMLIGRSTRTIDQAQTALSDPQVDYFCAGPVWETPTKPGRPAVGLDHLRRVADQVGHARDGKPWFAIGGIDRQRLPEVVAAGARRVVVVRAVTEADDVEAAAAALRAAVPAVTV